MKQFVVCSIALLSISTGINAQVKKSTATVKKTATVATNAPVMKNLLDTFSYAVGLNIAANMKQQGITNINAAMIQKALEDAYKNKPKLISDELAANKLQEQLMLFQQTKSVAEQAQCANEKAIGKAFLDKNKTRAGVVTLPDGLQYEVIKEGDPAAIKPKGDDTVIVHYAGTLINGTKFDNSYDRGEPATFQLNRVIRGWTELLQQMPKGSIYKTYIPSDLAYGDRGAGPNIPPGSTLIFEINLLDVKPAGTLK